LVIATNLGASRAAIEETVAYAAKMQTLSMADFLEDDLLLIGDGTEDTIEDVETNADGQTTLFSFWREDESGTDMLVAYTLTEADTIEIDGEEVQLYRLDRTENGVPAGGGSSTLESFQITMLNAAGNPAAGVGSARLLRVRSTNVYPFGDPDDMNMFRSYWGITVRPPNLDS
jgi:hypothetical protein